MGPGDGGNGVVRRWVARRARPFPLDGRDVLTLLPSATTGAAVVGLAAGVRSARESVRASHRVVHALVTRAGFRAVSVEGSTETGAALDRYVVTGVGDPERLVASSQSFLRTQETLDLVRWLRAFDVEHADDPVRVVHAQHAPRHPPRVLDQIERDLAQAILEWHEATGDRIVHLGGAAHTIVGDPRIVSPYSPAAGRNAGGQLRAVLGSRYQAMALTTGAGDATFPVPAPPAHFAESVFGGAAAPALLLDLHVEAPPPEVAGWLREPLRTRCIGPTYDPTRDSEFHVSAGPLHSAVDVLLHAERITPTTPLLPRPRQDGVHAG